MKRFKTQQAYFALIMLVVSVFLITGCGSDEAALLAAQFDSVLPGIDTCTKEGPKVNSSDPANNVVNVPIATLITATFSEKMDPTTIAYTNQGDAQVVTFTLYDNDRPGVLIPGTVEMDLTNTIATFKPTDVLAKGTKHTATITTYAKSSVSAGHTSLGCNYRWEFETVD
jgi:hypothetical protein